RAVVRPARFIGTADTAGELFDNRRGEPEILADAARVLAAMVEAAGNRRSNVDTAWADGLRRRQRERTAKSVGGGPAVGPDGKIHPARIFDAIAATADPDYIAIADGGDLLSFPRIGLAARPSIDPGPVGGPGVRLP